MSADTTYMGSSGCKYGEKERPCKHCEHSTCCGCGIEKADQIPAPPDLAERIYGRLFKSTTAHEWQYREKRLAAIREEIERGR